MQCQGTMLSAMDLQRVCAEKAAAVLVLCDKFSTDPSEFAWHMNSYHVIIIQLGRMLPIL